MYKDVATRPEVYFLMVRYANKDYLTLDDLQGFLEMEQGVGCRANVECASQLTGVTSSMCEQLIARFEPSAEGRREWHMTVDGASSMARRPTAAGFAAFLLSAECQLFDSARRQVEHDMTMPFAHYFVASSHRTYLIEDQAEGPSSVDGYICALRRACRLIERECPTAMDTWQWTCGRPSAPTASSPCATGTARASRSSTRST